MIADQNLQTHAHNQSDQSSQHLCHPRPAHAEEAGQRRPTLNLAGVEKQPVVVGELERIVPFFRRCFGLRFGLENAVPRGKLAITADRSNLLTCKIPRSTKPESS